MVRASILFIALLFVTVALLALKSVPKIHEGMVSKSALETRSRANGLRKHILTVQDTDPGAPWNARQAWIYLPTTPKPKDGYPYVLYFSFMNYDGTSNQTTPNIPGIYNLDEAAPCTKPGECNGETTIWIQMLLHLLLNSGVAIIMTTMVAEDSYFYVSCDKNDSDDLRNPYNICWNGYNPDKLYLQKLFGHIENGTAVPQVHNALAYEKCGLLGYSVGAQMVSRCYNEFPFLKTVPERNPFPTIAAGVMVSGGSMHCYEFCNGDKKSMLRGPSGRLCKKQPKAFEPCFDASKLGCCPKGLTEPNYDNGILDWRNHPPTLLAQTKLDSYADPNASTFYYEELQKRGVKSKLITGLGTNHNLFPAAVIPALDFFLDYLGRTNITSSKCRNGG